MPHETYLTVVHDTTGLTATQIQALLLAPTARYRVWGNVPKEVAHLTDKVAELEALHVSTPDTAASSTGTEPPNLGEMVLADLRATMATLQPRPKVEEAGRPWFAFPPAPPTNIKRETS